MNKREIRDRLGKSPLKDSAYPLAHWACYWAATETSGSTRQWLLRDEFGGLTRVAQDYLAYLEEHHPHLTAIAAVEAVGTKVALLALTAMMRHCEA